jgi:hypothetical protein
MATVVAAFMVAAAFTAAVAAASTAVVVVAPTAVVVVAPTEAQVPMAAIAAVNGKGTEVVADMGGWAENRHRHAIPAQQGVHRHWVGLTPRRDGTRLDDPAAAAERPQVTEWELPTVNGTPLVAPTVLLELRWQRTPGSAGMGSSPTAEHSVAEALAAEALAAEHSAAGAAVGAIPVMDLAGDAGPADGALASVGALAGILIGRCIRILTGTTCGGVILTATMLRPTTFILTLHRTSLLRNWVVPPGLKSYFPLYPALKRGAKLVRPSGAGFSCTSRHRIARK